MLRRSADPSGLVLTLHAASAAGVALSASIGLPPVGPVPEWVHLLPTGEIRTIDGRGPYRVADPAALVAASLQAIAGGGVVDENHATDLAAPRGEAAPARGWIREFQARPDGIWGRVEWTDDGERLVATRAYRGISPVIEHRPDGQVTAILRASLVNRPNLRGLATLHASTPSWETDMTLLARIASAIGLAATVTEDEALAAVTALHAEKVGASTALQFALDPIAKAVGLQAGADAASVLLGVQGIAAAAAGKLGGSDQVVTALQQELAAVTTQLNGLVANGKREKAEAFVDGAIKEGRVGVKPIRDRYIAMHVADPANAEALIAAMPVLGGGGQITLPATPPANGEVALNAEQHATATMLGIEPKAYAGTLKAEREAAL